MVFPRPRSDCQGKRPDTFDSFSTRFLKALEEKLKLPWPQVNGVYFFIGRWGGFL
jgi:hypothetical protein